MPLHIRSYQIASTGGTLHATLQLGYNPDTKEFGPRVRLSREVKRAEIFLGFADLNRVGELVRFTGATPLPIAEQEELEKEIQRGAR